MVPACCFGESCGLYERSLDPGLLQLRHRHATHHEISVSTSIRKAKAIRKQSIGQIYIKTEDEACKVYKTKQVKEKQEEQKKGTKIAMP